ncbi:MAG TPA: hypothetical protein VFE78_10020 [Gemmataceae bacterium]|jgi:hypothetical protein|nr:hypothetical protein [Gemmataceae bacterium]
MHSPTFPTNTHPNGRVTSSGPQANARPGPDAQPQAAENGRDTHGRFGKGNAGGPGNPFARQVAALRSALLGRVTAEDVEAVAGELIRQAKEGNLAAAKLLLSYTLGKPAPAVDPDTLDWQEWENYRRQPDPSPDMAAAAQRPTLAFALDYLRALLPSLTEGQKRLYTQEDRAREFEEQREAAVRAERRARREAKKARQAAAQPAERSAATEDNRGAAPPVAPTPPAPAAAAADAETLELLNELLALAQRAAPASPAAPSANGGAGGPGRPAPSANGGERPDTPRA